ncbi:hypothetical protein GNX72_21705 [Escherichia coli]|jgi:hypothetical protein|nr:hypothetical protein [Escherichia coli]EEJ48222.1 hypothetical protein HMPREF0358_1822 [Escherichia coli 83972]EFB4049797.1 hypothetical protein [Escherichia coli]EFG6534081.1 hypothetical protein [Escherichia coli]EFU9505752.1 hypothetical protein [Escherichia coli]EGO4546561.1 hypothetical protein [Escherichia coli]
MNGFKNDMDDEKSQKGKGSTKHSNKTPKTQPERFLAMQINNNAKTYSLTTQLNHRAEQRA